MSLRPRRRTHLFEAEVLRQLLRHEVDEALPRHEDEEARHHVQHHVTVLHLQAVVQLFICTDRKTWE